MKNIIELNTEIEKIFNPEIKYYFQFKNILFNGNWVNEINYTYYEELENRIIEKINLIADIESAQKIKFLKIFNQNLLEKYQNNLTIDYENIDSLNQLTDIIYFDPDLKKNKPSKDCSNLEIDNIDDYEPYFNTLLKVYKIDKGEWYDYFNAIELSDAISYIEEDIVEKHLLPGTEIKDDTYEEYYAFGRLSQCLSAQRCVIKRIAEYFKSLLNVISKIESFKDDNLNLEDINDNNPANIKLEFKLKKIDIAFFFKSLQDSEIIYVDNKNQKNQYTNLKKYIDDSNIYYSHNQKLTKLDRINKEFAKIHDDLYSKEMAYDEIKLLNYIIDKFNSRIETLKLSIK